MFDFIFISMPYARFISKWFANIPNINLGIMQSFLKQKGKKVKTFHFHLDFLPFIKRYDPVAWEEFLNGSEQFGIEYMGLDYVFASLFFEDEYEKSKDLFSERLESIGLTLNHFEMMRNIAKAFIDFCLSKISPFLKGTKLVGFSCSHYQLSSSLLLCSEIKKKYPEIRAIFGGKDCTGAFGYELMNNIKFLDFVGTGECEVTVESLLKNLNGSENKIFNVLYREKNGSVVKSETKPNLEINSLPFPEYDFHEFPLTLEEIILPIEFGRGCPWKRCTFCPDESYNIKYQAKTAERLREEIEFYRNISDRLKNFFILDSDALKDKKTITELSHYLSKKGFTFHYAEFRAERMDRDVLSSLLRFGKWASHFQIGIETFSDRVLKLMNKGVSVLKNVEVLKAVAELRVPIQFNLFTCFPNMTTEDMIENNRVMDKIRHILVHKNILIYPGEFYLPTDCPVFHDTKKYRIERHTDSIFACIFKDFSMPSYSNYPYPYQFDNDEEQYRMSQIIREKVDEIKSKNPEENFILYDISSGKLKIVACLDGKVRNYTFESIEKEVYLAALDKVQKIKDLSERFGIKEEDLVSILENFENEGLIIFSNDKKSFLSLALKYEI